MNSSITTTCAFCGDRAELKESHIIPKFVFDWLKETSGTGYIRFSQTPNRREQEGLKSPMLCENCEQRFSIWEKQVSEKIFKPLHNHPGKGFKYGKWLAKFCASVSWRVATFYKSKGEFKHFSAALLESTDRALQRWKDFILDVQPHPGPFEHHILPLQAIAHTSDPETPSNINRYFLRTVDIDAACTKTQAFVYAKMCHVLLVSFIEMPAAKHWRGTKVHINRGYVGGNVVYSLPASFGEYLKSRARIVSQALDSISVKQWAKITETYQKDLDRAANSESFRAMNFDVNQFGQAAFRNDKDE